MAEIIAVKEFEDLENIDNNEDIKEALSYISEFYDVHCCSIVKDKKPVGVALAATPFDAKMKAVDCNPIEAINATVAFSKEIDEMTAKMLHRMNFHTIITPSIKEKAKKYLEKSKSRVFEIGFRLDLYKNFLNEITAKELTPKEFKVATKLKPTQEQVEDLVFAWKVLKTIKKEAVVISKDFKIRAIEFGTSTKDIENAMDKACDGSKEAILAVSKNIDNVQKLHPAIQGRISAIIEPKNYDNKDFEVIKAAEKYGITVVTVGAEE